MKIKALIVTLPIVFVLLVMACTKPTPFSGDANCHFTVDSLSETSAAGSVRCDLLPTPTPVGSQVTVIQFADPDPVGITCGHPDVQDAWIVNEPRGTTWGNCDNVPGATYKLFIGYVAGVDDGEYRTVIQFLDLSAIPANAVVESALLTIKQTWCQTADTGATGCSGAALTIEAHQVTAPWGEQYVRWLEMPVYAPAPLDTKTVNNVLGAELTLDITQLFRDWLTGVEANNGVMLIANPLPANDFFRGRSHDTVCCSTQGWPPGTDAPKITVIWRLP